jgi:hypothetical protein
MGFSLSTSMEHHRCFRVYISQTRATRISDTVFFKNQYITNPTISPESQMVAAAQQLTIVLQGNIPTGNKTAEALQKVSKLFTKTSMAKNELAKAKTMRSRVWAKLSSMASNAHSKGGSTNSKGGNASSKGDQIIRGAPHPDSDHHPKQRKIGDNKYNTLPVPHQIAQAPASRFKSLPCTSLTNYISQDEDDNQAPTRRSTRLTAKSIMQEAMLSCVDIYKPNYAISVDLGILNYTKPPKPTGTTFTVSPKQKSQRKLPMKWLCKMANSVMGVDGELLEYHHLITNQTIRATWHYSYGNKIGRLAQGMPGRNTSTNTIVFIKKPGTT